MRCPDCGGELKRVRQKPPKMFNKYQFESMIAGHYYCETCKGDRGSTGYRYFWEAELTPPEQEPDQ